MGAITPYSYSYMPEFTVENVVELNNLGVWAEENGFQNFAIRWQEEAHIFMLHHFSQLRNMEQMPLETLLNLLDDNQLAAPVSFIMSVPDRYIQQNHNIRGAEARAVYMSAYAAAARQNMSAYAAAARQN